MSTTTETRRTGTAAHLRWHAEKAERDAARPPPGWQAEGLHVLRLQPRPAALTDPLLDADARSALQHYRDRLDELAAAQTAWQRTRAPDGQDHQVALAVDGDAAMAAAEQRTGWAPASEVPTVAVAHEAAGRYRDACQVLAHRALHQCWQTVTPGQPEAVQRAWALVDALNDKSTAARIVAAIEATCWALTLDTGITLDRSHMALRALDGLPSPNLRADALAELLDALGEQVPACWPASRPSR